MCLQPQVFSKRYTVHITKIEPYAFGNGGSADVWKGGWKEGDGGDNQELAVKVPRCASAGADTLAKLSKRLIQEGWVWSTAIHPNITPFLGISFDFDRPGLPCLVSPYYRHGNIINYLKERPHINKLPLVTQVASALSYLHGLAIIHGDIKGCNILINDDGEASLADFGLSRILQASGFTTKTASGTWRFMPPELLVGQIQQVTPAADVWSFAMTVIEILTGRLPFSHITSNANVILNIMAGGRPKWEHCLGVKADIWEKLESCWDVDPNLRPSMANISHFLTS